MVFDWVFDLDDSLFVYLFLYISCSGTHHYMIPEPQQILEVVCPVLGI